MNMTQVDREFWKAGLNIRPLSIPKQHALDRKGMPKTVETRSSFADGSPQSELTDERDERPSYRVVGEARAVLRDEESLAEAIVTKATPLQSICAQCLFGSNVYGNQPRLVKFCVANP